MKFMIFYLGLRLSSSYYKARDQACLTEEKRQVKHTNTRNMCVRGEIICTFYRRKLQSAWPFLHWSVGIGRTALAIAWSGEK